ncbi:unnamed protein product, partial [Medioppia subpectinata]
MLAHTLWPKNTNGPKYSPLAYHCLNKLSAGINECQRRAKAVYGQSTGSPSDDCCAEWYYIDCALDYMNLTDTKCSERGQLDLARYFLELKADLGLNTCANYSESEAYCMVPVLRGVEPDIAVQPPLPEPLAIDCLLNINKDIRAECAQVAEMTWHISNVSIATPKQICCAAWQDIDCLDEIATIRCNNIELVPTEEYFKLVEDWLEDYWCADYIHHSSECSLSEAQKSNLNIKTDMTIELVHSVGNNKPGPLAVPGEADSNLVKPPNNLGTEGSDSQAKLTEHHENHMLEYMMAIFPYLLLMMLLLALVLFTIIVVQCIIIRRQLRHDSQFAMIKHQVVNAVNCLSHLDRDIQLCQSQALEYWNISPSSSLADSCCAKWDHFECSMDVLNKSDCSDKEKQDLSEWFANVESFYANETCVNHTKHSVQCADIMMSQLPGADPTPNPPLPDPLAIDCLGH